MIRYASLLVLAMVLSPPASAQASVQGDGACSIGAGPAILAPITGLKDRQGELKLELYPATQEDFTKDDRDLIRQGKVFRRVRVPAPQSGPVALCIQVPRPGRYALLFTHNRDGQNKFRYTIDGAGVPNNKRIGMAKPKVDAAIVNVGDGVATVPIRAQYLGLFGFSPVRANRLAMRIVDVNEFYSPTGGGVRTYVDRKMAILASMGHELIVIAPGREDRVEERPGGGRIIYVKAPGLPFDANYGLFWDAAPINSLLDELDPDVIENCSPWRPAWIVGARQGRALKSFFMHNDNMESYAKRWLGGVASPPQIERAFGWYTRYMQRFLTQFDTVVTNGPALVKRMTARGIPIDAALTLGIERSHFSPAHRDPRLRAAMLKQCELPTDGHLLIGLGRHHPEKRWPMVIDAVERAGATLPLGLVLIGHGMDTKAIERRVANSPHIRLFRPVYDRTQLARILASADAFIHGSETETFGLVVSEALASGTPLIVPDDGGAAEVAAPAYAETFTARDARACADAIGRLFSRDQALLRRAAGVAAAKVRSDREHADALIAHYNAAIAAKMARAA